MFFLYNMICVIGLYILKFIFFSNKTFKGQTFFKQNQEFIFIIHQNFFF